MNPGRFDEQPMPLITTTWCGLRPSSKSAACSADSTEKSPQPGHQSGWILPLNESLTSCAADLGDSAGGVSRTELIDITQSYTRISWAGTERVVLPSSCSLT